MLQILSVDNPFTRFIDSRKIRFLENGLSVRGVCETLEPGFEEFANPTFVIVNGRPVMRKDWDKPLPVDSSVAIVQLANGLTAIIIAVVVIVVAVVVAVVVKSQAPAAVGQGKDDTQNGDTVYSLSGEKNQVRLNDAIECGHGRNKMYPSYAAQPYSTYIGNQQYQSSLFCLGHGWYDIEQMAFEDTPLQHFEDVAFEIVNPGMNFTLFADNVKTSADVSSIELYGPNEKDYTGPTGAYVANDAGTTATRLEVDIVLPGGLYKLNDANKPQDATVKVLFEYQRINDLGNPIGNWLPLIFTNKTVQVTIPTSDPNKDGVGGQGMATKYQTEQVDVFEKTMHTLTPQRFTMGADVTAGRYQVRATRQNDKDTDAGSGDEVQWESLRAFMPNTKNYGDVTLIAVKARASNNLNNDASQRFNVICTRMLPTWKPGTGWSGLVATRNPVWAFCDVFRATYGGRLPDTFLDLPELYTHAQYFASKGICFDNIFDQATTVWDAATAIALVGRGIPYLNGSQLTIIRDQEQTIATAVFNAFNIVQGSFTWEAKLVSVQPNDGIEVQYMDANTWQQETVLCLIGSDAGDNPEQMKLPGCSDRNRAFQEGLYRRAVELYCNETITFDTGLEGHLPRYGDLVLVSHDVPRWGLGGLVKSIVGTVIELSEHATFAEGNNVIVLRKKDGSALGPFICQPGADDLHVVVAPAIDPTGFFFDNDHELPYFLFGQENLESKKCVITGITPKDSDTITLTCTNYDERVFSFAGIPAPAVYAPPAAIVLPARPVVKSIKVARVIGSTDLVQISWPPTLGAQQYVLETSVNSIDWVRVATTPDTVYIMHVQSGQLNIRLAGVNTDIGPYVYWQGEVGDVSLRPDDVTGLHVTDLAPGSVTFGWNALTGADSFQITVYDNATLRVLRVDVSLVTSYTYTLDMGDVDGLTQDTIMVRIKGVNIVGVSPDSAVYQQTIPERLAPVLSITVDALVPTVDDSNITADHT